MIPAALVACFVVAVAAIFTARDRLARLAVAPIVITAACVWADVLDVTLLSVAIAGLVAIGAATVVAWLIVAVARWLDVGEES